MECNYCWIISDYIACNCLIRKKISLFFTTKKYIPITFIDSLNYFQLVFSSGLLQINILIGTIIASYESGAIFILIYADRIYQLPLALIGIAISVALLPSISSKIKSESLDKIHQSIEQTLLYSLMFAVPRPWGFMFFQSKL